MIDKFPAQPGETPSSSLSLTSPIVYVVDDEPSVRRTIRLLIQSAGLLVSEYGTVDEFAKDYDSARPSCLVIDHQLVGMTGLEFIETMSAKFNALSSVLITGYATTDTVVRAMKAGVVQVLDKPFEAQRLLQAVHEALHRNQALRDQQATTTAQRTRFDALTERELQVLRLLVQGQMNKNISKRLSISVRAVEQRRRQIFVKTGTTSVAELVAAVIELKHQGIDVLAAG